ncbi:muscle M-line assembly protein unc-89-like isoform X2 [Vanessa atalanta]|uniref:muscle M-line assembly protein unc-89-like isoform X2 n=1 Tax=Vanessa atalanta TaxID=42275 RepID=UPI001FCD9BF8|nr:muscle M-line assembly protein unc-89-like isoform X2 [Vanessa atalanta]
MGSNCCKGDAAGKPLVRSSSSIYNRSRAGAKLDDRFSKSDDAGGVRLTITAARTGDSGVYTLQASNAAGKDTTRVRLEVSPDEMPTGEDPPTFLRRLQDLTVKVGTRTRFLVEIVSSTECRVTWYRNERRLLEAERIALVRDGNFWCADISAVSVDDAGRWTCTAENVGGRASCSAHLNVLVPKAYKRPEFVEELRALLTEQGTVSLECKVVGVPTPVLRWFKDSREIKAGDVFALTANAEDPTSLGTYTCEAVNCMGRAYSSSKVHVVGRASREGSSRPSSGGITPEPPPIFTKELEDHFIRICEPLTLSCNIVVPPWPRNVVWYNKEGKIDPSERYRVLEDGVGGYLLEIPIAEWPDEGEWKCVVTSTGGRVGISTCYVSMDVPKNYRKPRFMENLQAVLTEEGLVSFECKVVGFPTPVLSWFKDGQELKPGDVYQLTGTNSLGSYCCIARNCMGQASSSAELTVEDIQNQLNEDEKLQLFSKNQAPKFLQGLKSIEAKIDEPFRFTIKIAIPPEPTVSWYRDDQPVDESLRCHHGKEERGVFFLDIQNLEFMDQAEWKCVAMNNYGHSVTSCFLKLIIPRHYKKPRFLENLQAILSDEGAVNLECKVIGVPQPVLKWYKDGEELKPGDIHRIISGQDGTCCLGTYTCEAQNCMGIAASSASLLGFEDSMKAKSKKKADEQALQRNLSLSTIHEERTSQMYDTPVGDITLDEKGEISFSFDGKEVSVSLYETPDLTEEEALQIVEMYADQLSENVTEHNVVELPPLRFVKETSTSGNLLMEAIIIDVSPEYFTSPEEDLRTEADIEDISIADENGPPQLSLDQEVEGEDYLEKTIAMLSDEIADFPKKVNRKKSDSQRSADDYFSLSRDQSLSEEKKDDDTQILSESDLQSYASARSSGKPKSKSSKPSIEDGQESSDITKTVLLKEDLQNKALETEASTTTPKKQRRRSRSSRRSSSGSEKSLNKMKDIEIKTEPENLSTNLDVNKEIIKTVMNDTSLSLTEVMNEIQILERDIILKSEFMSTAATASNSLEIINSLITPLSEIHSITDAIRETVSESSENITPLLNTLPQSLKNLQDSLTIISKCIDVESDNKTLVKKTCMSIIRNCGNQLHNIIRNLNDTICNESLFVEKMQMSNIETVTTDLINIIHYNIDILKSEENKKSEKGSNVQEATLESKHLHATQKAIHELRGSLRSLLFIIDEVDNCNETNYVNIKKSEIILNDMSTPIQDLQTALEQIEILSVTESNSDLQKYNTEIIEKAMESVLKLRTSFEQLSGEESTIENKDGLNEVLNEIKINIREISIQLEELETKTGKFDILSSDNKLETLQKIAQILINLENNLPILESASSVKGHMTEFHKNLTKVLENVIESNDANKYFTLLEICDAVNRMNTSIKSIETNNVLSMASIGNTLKIIYTNVSNNVFEQELNFSMLENISNLLVCIQETTNKAEELRINENLEEVKDLSLEKYEESKVNVVLENIEQTIIAISNVISHESLTSKDFSLKKAMENICPILVDLKYCIASSNVKATEKYEKISELESLSLSQSIANPLIDLHQNISVLNQVICENADSREFSVLLEDYAKPLLDLRDTLEILQHDVISQYLDNEPNPELNTSIANVVESLKSCIVMIQEQHVIEAADDMSTLEDISGIKTTADVLPSDEFTMVTVNEMENVQFAEETIPSASGQALQILKETINTLQDSELLNIIDSIEIPEYSSIKSINIGLEEVSAQIESILHPITIESCEELSRFSQLVEIIQPLQEIRQHLSVIDIDNIPVYENKADSTPEKMSLIKENIQNFKSNLNDCLDVLQPAIEITDTTIEISTKISNIRHICDEVNSTLDKLEESITSNKGISTVNNRLKETVNLFVKTINSPDNTEQVKHAIENLYEAVILIKEDLTQFVYDNPESLSIENTFIQLINDMEKCIISLEQYNFVNLTQLYSLKKKVIEIKEIDKRYNVNQNLAELIAPLDLIYKKMLLDSKEEKEAQEIVVIDSTPFEMQLSYINENIKKVEQCLNLENISINRDDISVVIKLNETVNCILNYMKNTQMSECFKPTMQSIKTLGKILHRILSPEKVEDKHRSLKEKAETLLQHMDHYIEIIEIVEEVSAVIKIEDLKESANIVRELQQSIVTSIPSSEVTTESSSNNKIKEEQAEIAQRLHKALMMLQTQALESTQELTTTANEDIRQQIIEVISDLQNDFIALKGTNLAIEESLKTAGPEISQEKTEVSSQDGHTTQATLESEQRNLLDESEKTAKPEMIQEKTEVYSQDAQTTQVILESEQRNLLDESETTASFEMIQEKTEDYSLDTQAAQVIIASEQRNDLDESETTAGLEIIQEKTEEYSLDVQSAQVILESEQRNDLDESETTAGPEISQEKTEVSSQDGHTTQATLESEQRNLLDESEKTAKPEMIQEKTEVYSQDAQTTQVILESEQRNLLDESETTASSEMIQEKTEDYSLDAQAAQVTIASEQRNDLDESETTAGLEIIQEKTEEYSLDVQSAQVILESEQRNDLDESETTAGPEISQEKTEVSSQDGHTTQVILESVQRNLLDESEKTAKPEMIQEKTEVYSQDAQTTQIILESEQQNLLDESETTASPEMIQEKTEEYSLDAQAVQVIYESEQRNDLDESKTTVGPEISQEKTEVSSQDEHTTQVILESEQRNVLDESEKTAKPEMIQEKTEVYSQDAQSTQAILESEQRNLLDESENTKDIVSKTEQPIQHLESNDQYKHDKNAEILTQSNIQVNEEEKKLSNDEKSLIDVSELKKPSSKFENLATIKDILIENIKEYISDETMIVLSKLSHPLHCEHLKKTIEIATQLWNKTVSESSSPEQTELSSFTTEQIELVLSLNEAILIMYETTIEESQELEIKVGKDELNVFKDVVNNLRCTLQEIISNMNTLTYFAEVSELQPEKTNKDLVENIQPIPSVSHTTPRSNEIEKINEAKYNIMDTSSIEVVGSLENNNNILKSGDVSDVKMSISATDLHTAKKEDIICKMTTDTKNSKEFDEDIKQKPVNKGTLLENLSNYISDDIVNVIDKLSPVLNLENVNQSIQTAHHLYNILSLDESDTFNFTTEQLKFALLLDNAVSSLYEFANQETEEYNVLVENCELKKANNVMKELQNNLHVLIESTLTQSDLEVLDMDDFKVSITKDPLSYRLLICDNFSDAKSSKESMEDNKESILYTKDIEIAVPPPIETTDELIIQGIQAEVNIETSEDTTLISEKNLEVTLPNLKEDLQLNKDDIDSIIKLDKLLKEVSDMIDLSCDDNIEPIHNTLDEVQTIIMELKSDFGGTVGDVNETLEDLECNVRSVQLQINEHSPPVLLKEACANLQVLVAHLGDLNDVEKVLRPHTYEITNDILDVCSNDIGQTIDIIETVSCSEKAEKLEHVISNLNKIKDTIKLLRSNFLTNAETLIMGGIEIIQSLDQIEERIFCLEKDLESENNVDVITRDSILSAIHSIYGSISNMRGTVSSVQKKYMYENYGEPSRYFLLSIKNVLVLFKNNEGSSWKEFAKSLRKVLNHFEDVKFYINFDKTARLPSDAAFTKIILAELHSVLSEIVLQEAKKLDEEPTKHTCDVINYVNKILKDIEQNTTLEVKEKIPIFKELSKHMFELTENFKLFIENEIKSNRNNVVDYNTDVTSLLESTTVQEENIPEKLIEKVVLETDNTQNSLNIEFAGTSTNVLSKKDDNVIEERLVNTVGTEKDASLKEENIESDKLIQEIKEATNIKDQIENKKSELEDIENIILKLESGEETKEEIKSIDIISTQQHTDNYKINKNEQLTIIENTNDEKKEEIDTNKNVVKIEKGTVSTEYDYNQEIDKNEQLQMEKNVEDIDKISRSTEIVEDIINQDNIAVIDNNSKENVTIMESQKENIENKGKIEGNELEVVQYNLLEKDEKHAISNVMEEGEIAQSMEIRDENNKPDDASLFIKYSIVENEELVESITNKIEEVVNSNVINEEIQENMNITTDKPISENISDKSNEELAIDINLKEKGMLVDEQLSENKISIIEQDNAISVTLKEEGIKDDIKLEKTSGEGNSDIDQLKRNSIIENKLLEEQKSKTDDSIGKDMKNDSSMDLPTVTKPQSVLDHKRSSSEEEFPEKTLHEIYKDHKETVIQAEKISPENDENKENITIHESILKEYDKNDVTLKEIIDIVDSENNIQTNVLNKEYVVEKLQEEELELQQHVEDKQRLSNTDNVIDNENIIDIPVPRNIEEQPNLIKDVFKTDRIEKDDEIDKIEEKNLKTKSFEVENGEEITKLMVAQLNEEESIIKTEENQENKNKEGKIENDFETENKNLSLIEEKTKDCQKPKEEQISIDKDLKNNTEEKNMEIKEKIKIETITSLEVIDQVTSPLNISLEIKENVDIKIVENSLNEIIIKENIVQIAPTKEDEKIKETGREVDSNLSCLNDEICDENLETASQGQKHLVNIESTSDIENVSDGVTTKSKANCELLSEIYPESKENIYAKSQVDNQSDLNDKYQQAIQIQQTTDNEQGTTINASKIDIHKKLDNVSQLQNTVTEAQEVLVNVTENQTEIEFISKPETPMTEHIETEINVLKDTDKQIDQHFKENLDQEKDDVSKIQSHIKNEILEKDEKSNKSVEVQSVSNKIETSENEKETKLTKQQSPKLNEENIDTNKESVKYKSKKEQSPEIKSNEKDITSKEKETFEFISNQLQEETSIEQSELAKQKHIESKDQTQVETATKEEESKTAKRKESSIKQSKEKRRSKKSRETLKQTAVDNDVKPQEAGSKELDKGQVNIIEKPDEGPKLQDIPPEGTKNKIDKNEEQPEKKKQDYEENKSIQEGTEAKDVKVDKIKPQKMIVQEKKGDKILTGENNKIKDNSQVPDTSEQKDKGIISKLDNKSIFEEKENKDKDNFEIDDDSRKLENNILSNNQKQSREKSFTATLVKDDRQEVENRKVYPVIKEHSLTDYESEFPRPPGYIAKPFGIEETTSQIEINTKGQTIYKAQTLIGESQLRSPILPHIEQNLNHERQSQIKDRTKALSECRSTLSEKRSSSGRDNRRKPVFSTFLTDRTAVEGSRVKLTCSILSPTDPKISWYKNGKELDNKHKFRSKFVEGLITLEILNAMPSDSGEYSCSIENENGSITSSANLKVYPSFEASPIPPTFTRSIRDNYHLAENELILECRIRGQPLPTITWLKDDKPIPLSDRYQAHYLADGVCRLTISSPSAEDSGKYTCKAENSMWSDQISHDVYFTGRKSSLSPNLATVEKVQLSRHVVESRRPHFTNVLSDHKVVSGGTIGLQVEIRGSPIRVEWLREGHSITELYRNAQTYVDHGIYTLALSDVTEQESGLYTCRAYSTQGNVDMNASITVVQPNQYDGKPASIVSRPERDVLISVGEDLNISFRVHGEPKAKVFFMKGIRDITNSQRVCKMTSDDYVKFTLKRTVVSDAGTYCIFARNAYGCDRAFVTVVIRQRASSDSLISDWTYPMDDLAISSVDRNYKSVPDRIPSEPSAVDGGNNWISLAWPKPDQQSRAPILAYKVESWLLGKEGGARWVELGITPRNSFDAFNLKQGEEYHFRVSPRNRYGWGESVQTSVPIGIGLAGDRPEFVDILPGQLKVLVGETATLFCSFKGKPIPEIVWMKNGHEIEEEVGRVSIEINDYNSSLRIEEVKSEDEGRYSCEATNIHGRSSTYSRMAVITDRQIWQADAKLKRERSAGVDGEYPPQFTMRLRDRRVQATYPVRLTCQVVGNPTPTVKWFKNEEEVFFDGRHTASQDEYFYTLEIAPTTLEDGGVYEAMARNGCGAVSCRCSLVVDKGIRAYIAPEFCCGLEPLYHLSEGDELRISAIVEAYPSVGVTWYRDGVRLRPSRRAIMTLDRDGQIELAVASVTGRDAGVYTCTASNEVGTASTSGKVEIVSGEHVIEKTTMPPILVTSDAPYSKEPMFIRKPRSSEAREGDTVIIECEVIGDPKPDVYWLRDFLKPDYYRDSSHFKRVGAGPAYRFEIPHAKLDYTGAYSIVAKNIHGETKAIISLQILAKDLTCGDDVHNIRYGRVDVIPRFDKELTDLLCYDGDAIEFECSVSGNPDPDIRWLHYNEIVPDCVDFESSYEVGIARLKIKQVTAEDEGTYTCEASNSLGKASSSACLVVYPPGEPNTLSQRLRRPPALLSAASTPRSTPRTTPARSLSRTPGPDPRRFCSPSREIAPKFYTYPYNRVAEEGDTIVFQCAVKGLPPPWATWDKDGIIITPSARISIKEKDEMLRILEIEQVTIEDVGLYRISLENEYGRAEASARLEVITQKGKFYGSTRSYSVSPRKTLPYRRRTPSFSKQD